MARARALSPSEIAQILAALESSRDKLMVSAGLALGFRVSELLSLRVGDVWRDGPAQEITVSRAKLKGGAGRYRRSVRSRSVPVSPELAEAIRGYIFERYGSALPNAADPLFPGRYPGRPLSRKRAYAVIKQAAGGAPRIGTHSWRKAFAARVYEASGHDLMLCRTALGHRSISTTAAYLEVDEERLRAVLIGSPTPAPASRSEPTSTSLQVA
jgi:integrase